MIKAKVAPARRRNFALVIGIAVLAGAVILPASAGTDPVDSAIEELDEAYASRAEAIPDGPQRGTALTSLNEEYEKDFAAIGHEAPNGPNPSLAPEEKEPNLVATGIQDATESPPGYVLTNYWAAELPEGRTIFVAGAALEGDAKLGGVYVADDTGEDFYPSPATVGPLTVTGVNGTRVELVAKSGEAFRFDYVERSFVRG